MTPAKHVIITGGSSGIGAAIAEIYAARGAHVSLIARGLPPLQAQLEALSRRHPEARFHAEPADVRDGAALEAAIARCEHIFGPCDVLVTSAGIVDPGTFEALPADRFQAQIDTNLTGTINAVRAVYAGMAARRSGRIILIASGAGLIGIFGYAAYCASKFGLVGFAEALRQEARTLGVGVSICFPPDTLTPQLEAELKVRPPESAAIIGVAGAWPADKVARLTVERAERGYFAIYPGSQIALLARFASLISPGLRMFADNRISKARKAK